MEGILIAIGMMALFALIGSNRFVLLRKAADKAFLPFDKLSGEKYRLLQKDVSASLKTIDKEVEETEEERKLKELESFINKAQNPQLDLNQKVKAENQVSQMLYSLTKDGNKAEGRDTSLFKPSAGYKEIEENLKVLKKQYNEAVLDYNNAVFMFPSNVFALIFRYRPRTTFQFPEETPEQTKRKFPGRK